MQACDAETVPHYHMHNIGTRMIRFSTRGTNLLLVAQGRVLNGEGHSLGTGHLFPFEPIHLNVVKYFHEMQRIL